MKAPSPCRFENKDVSAMMIEGATTGVFEKVMDRTTYLGHIRRELLKRLGLPSDLSPEGFRTALESQGSLDRRLYFRGLRGDILRRLGLPPDTSPERFLAILEKNLNSGSRK